MFTLSIRSILTGCMMILLFSIHSNFKPAAAPSETYHRYSLKGRLANLPIWMELEVPDEDGTVTGTYFYIKNGNEIGLSGSKTGSTLTLEERYNNKVTGYFDLEYAILDRNSFPSTAILPDTVFISGTWKKTEQSKIQIVEVTQTDSSAKRCLQCKPGSLIMKNGHSFGSELDAYSGDEYYEEGSPVKRRDFEITSCRNGLMSTFIQWSYFANGRGYPDVGTIHHTFNLAKNREIDLWEEIDSGKTDAFLTYAATLLEPALAKIRSNYDDSVWIDILGYKLDPNGEYGYNSLDELFKGADRYRLEFYLKLDTIMIGYTDYFGINSTTAMQMELYDTELFVPASFTKIKKYLHKNSVLRQLQ